MSLDVPVEMYNDICSGLCDLNIDMIWNQRERSFVNTMDELIHDIQMGV